MSEPQNFLVALALTAVVVVAIMGLIWRWCARNRHQLTGELIMKQVAIDKLEAELLILRGSSDEIRARHMEDVVGFTSRVATLEADNRHLQQELDRREADQKQLTTQFEILSADILRRQGNEFSAQNLAGLKTLLEPMGEKIRDFERKVAESYERGLRDQLDLRSEIKKLHDLNQQISIDAVALTRALRADSAVQGTWGEVVLQRVLERSGLVEGVTFQTQTSVADDDGSRWRPDVVILLPDNKHLIVDAKVSLTAWEHVVNAADEDQRTMWLTAHTESVKRHVIELGSRDYSSLAQFNSPDFVVLFMPVEAAFGAALQHDPSLFGLAWEKRVVLTGPATLLATLRTVASVWRIEQQNRNVYEIARQGGLLYDRLMAFAEEMNKIGLQIDRLKGVWQKASDRLATGKGNLVSRAARLKHLGANTRAESTGFEKIDNLPSDENDESLVD